MEKEDIDLALEEFTNSVEGWTKLSLDTLYHTSDLDTRNSEREFNLYLAMTSLSVAFLTIVVPLIKDFISITLIITIFFAFTTTIFGITSLRLTIKRDKRLIKEDGDWEHSILKVYLSKNISIRSKLYDYKKRPENKLWEEITLDVKNYFESKKELNIEAEKRQLIKEKEPSAIQLHYLKISFWWSIYISLFFLILWIVTSIYC